MIPPNPHCFDVEKQHELHVALDDAHFKYETARHLFLSRAGWRHTAETPGNVWLWSLTSGDQTYLLPTDEAVEIQRRWTISQYAKAHPALYGVCHEA